MNSQENILASSAFTKNRAEELGLDVWKHFVVPPFYDNLDLREARKPRIIVGGRGCGKTMLLRYLSHHSAFSRNRPVIPNADAEHIGLYWRIDTQFARVMTGRAQPDDVWLSAFNHLLALIIGAEILSSIGSIATSASTVLSTDDLESTAIDIKGFDPSLFGKHSDILKALKTKIAEFEMWVANVRKRAEPDFLPGHSFLNSLVQEIRDKFPKLEKSVFFVYIDEFENLLPYQQSIVNTCLKHSESPLIFNVAMKRHAFETNQTLSEESITNIADFRTHNLEEYLLADGVFELFAAEVLLLNMGRTASADLSINLVGLQDPQRLPERRKNDYRDKVLQQCQQILPGASHADLASDAMKNPVLCTIIKDRIKLALRNKRGDCTIGDFFREDFPEATITCTALLNRSRLNAKDIAAEFDLYTAGKSSKFAGWIHNNYVGCLLWLYNSQSSIACPLFAGFRTFCLLARGNLRHLLELCYRSVNQLTSSVSVNTRTFVPLALQAKAARETSAIFLDEIPGFGRHGDQLHVFTLRLGYLFQLAHKRATQSEPEQSHFSISKGETLGEDQKKLLKEAGKWSVLFEEKETKLKSEYGSVSFEYILNPIYSPYFNITYRKKRKLELSGTEVTTLMNGSNNEVTLLLKTFSDKWNTDSSQDEMPLLSRLFADK